MTKGKRQRVDCRIYNKQWFDKLTLILLVPTFGIGTWISSVKANQQGDEGKKNTLMATASGRNGEITKEAGKCKVKILQAYEETRRGT